MNKLIALGVAAIIGLISLLVLFDVTKIEGNQMGVKETWGEGVVETPLGPKTYFLFPGFTQEVYKYDMGLQIYVMNDHDTGEEYAEGRKADAYVVQSKDQQDMRVSLRVQWRRLPNRLVELHKFARDLVEERVLRPALLNVVKNQATLRTALDAYSGEGLVKLQDDILADLQNHEELNQYIRVDTFVIEHIGLNKEYTDQIVARQVAVQERLKNIEQTRAAESAAEKAKALAQADYEKTIVEARRDKEKGILESEKLAQQQVLKAQANAKEVELQADAEKNRNISIATGEKEAGNLRAQAILVLGQAEAEATRLKLSAYSAEGAESFVQIEVAKSMANAFQNIQGYLPENMSVNLLAENFSKGVNLLVTPQTNAPAN